MYWGENSIQIGCKKYNIEQWKEKYKSIGSSEQYSNEQIVEYGEYITMIEAFHAKYGYSQKQLDNIKITEPKLKAD